MKKWIQHLKTGTMTENKIKHPCSNFLFLFLGQIQIINFRWG